MGARLLAQGYKTGTLYLTTNMRDKVAVAIANGDFKLWHLKFGHMSKKG
jgi:hypothetical protein